jgi:hypothetical protein
LRFGIIRGGKSRRQLQQQALARKFRPELEPVIPVRFLCVFCARRVQHFVRLGRDLFRIFGNEILFDPGRPRGFDAQVK